MLHTRGLTVNFHRIKFNNKRGVGIVDGIELVPTGADGHTQFLGEFSKSGGLNCLARFKLSSRELP